MRSSSLILSLAATAFELVSAHGYVAGVEVNGADWTAGGDPVWYYYPAGSAPVTAGWKALNQDNGFVSPDAFTSSDIACHKSATAAQSYINANAGDTLTFFWNTWPDTHKGPIINYIAPCNGECTAATAGSLQWTKISQGGLISGSATGTWVTDALIANNFTSDAVIPAKLKAGNYVIRHEIIALHGASNDNGAQNYPQCLNLKVGGSGTVAPPTGTPGTSLYTRSDPGILFNLYTSFTSYPIPGPALWTGAN
ncbi:glycoside hydrolase [Pseudomassariella vexata]|uniref:lytic cellulose monooxygenase (C4-dehydrogenating) n=1 Tax=Pseudomassariella vexata TaxID=1141098 RepID=A0A1Y2DIE6_9PEZI|nr:glycoside hydrolase [Pseudomassariella vexata]ORY58916.1 glycoside hydrolase [Pseudomassariella vexata]